MAVNNLISKVFKDTNSSFISMGILFLRLTIGILLFIAGSGKAMGWFGGYGMDATLQGYGKMGFSALLAYLSMYTEFLGGLLLIVGFLTRFAAFAIMINMLVATIVTLPNGFMGPTGAQTPFLFLVIDVVILLTGPMTHSLDFIFFRSSGYREKS